MRIDSFSRANWVLAGIALRLVMLGWGIFQDSTSPLPYTDIDYHVFTSASQYLLTACPLEDVISVSPQEEYVDLIIPPEGKGGCAQGILPAVCRFFLQTEPEIRNVETSSLLENEADLERIESKIVFSSFSMLRPVFKILAGMGNPYKRDTYRYSPLLALILTPGHLIGGRWGADLFGKMLFILADIIVALLIWNIMDVRRSSKDGDKESDSWLTGVFWLVNPFTAQISTRGSSESLLGVLVLGFLDATLHSYPEKGLLRKGNQNRANVDSSTRTNTESEQVDDPKWSNAALMAPFLFAFAIHWKLYPIIYAAALVPHLIRMESFRAVIRFGGIALYSLFGICGSVYAIWGSPYLDETIFYHLSRSDHRHNFSPFFLPSYLSMSPLFSDVLEGFPHILVLFNQMQSYLAFLPQLALTAYLGFFIGGDDLVAAMTFQTIAFVALNKVCTSQYYMWIIWFLPILAPSLHFPNGTKDVLTLLSLWVIAQVIWLSQAYLLEFKARNTFVTIWLASLLLLFTHIWLLLQLTQAWANGKRKTILENTFPSNEKAKESSVEKLE